MADGGCASRWFGSSIGRARFGLFASEQVRGVEVAEAKFFIGGKLEAPTRSICPSDLAMHRILHRSVHLSGQLAITQLAGGNSRNEDNGWTGRALRRVLDEGSLIADVITHTATRKRWGAVDGSR